MFKPLAALLLTSLFAMPVAMAQTSTAPGSTADQRAGRPIKPAALPSSFAQLGDKDRALACMTHIKTTTVVVLMQAGQNGSDLKTTMKRLYAPLMWYEVWRQQALTLGASSAELPDIASPDLTPTNASVLDWCAGEGNAMLSRTSADKLDAYTLTAARYASTVMELARSQVEKAAK